MKNKLIKFGVAVLTFFVTIWCVGCANWWREKAFAEVEEKMGDDTEAQIDLDVIENIELPDLYIKAINPGYTVDGVSNVGEMIELGRKSTDKPFLLAGITVSYTNSSGNQTILLEFPENSWMTGETLLLRLASSPGSELAAVKYTKTLAMKGSLTLMREDEIMDMVCWTGQENCYKDFKSATPTTLVRDTAGNTFSHQNGYEPQFLADSYYVEKKSEELDGHEDEGYGAVAQCNGLQFSEILSYYEMSRSEQFIELYNANSEQVLLDGCALRYKNKSYVLHGIVKPDGYFVYYPVAEFSLTKNPTNSNMLELIDINGETVDAVNYPNGQRKGTSYAWVGYDEKGDEVWRTTYAVTPGEANAYQEFKTCEAGKVINKTTGNCVKVTEVVEKVCAEGQYLNLLTGRCKKYEEAKTTACKDGYYLNPETGRCRKIKENTGADYHLMPETQTEKSSFVATYIVIGVVAVGLGYVFMNLGEK